MATAGIICEYNPFHMGHAGHIEKTRKILGEDCAVICVMSGNFVQRGDLAVFNKHARAKMAILGGADLVIELPAPFSLLSAEGFATAGVYLLDSLGICDHISFGSESGDISALGDVASALVSDAAAMQLKEWLKRGLPYASAQQKAADAVLGERSVVLGSPNNLLGIEYLKAIKKIGSKIHPLTVPRTGDSHDNDAGLSAASLRKKLLRYQEPWGDMPYGAAMVGIGEIAAGRGPVSVKSLELAMLSRLRMIEDFSGVPGVSEGLDNRLKRYALSEPTVAEILEKTKTKRYSMSRIRRLVMCACLGITAADTKEPPPYVRVLAMNATGMKLLKDARKKTLLPVITKPASVRDLSEQAIKMFVKECEATDLYVLAYPDEIKRVGGQEWRMSPVVVGS